MGGLCEERFGGSGKWGQGIEGVETAVKRG